MQFFRYVELKEKRSFRPSKDGKDGLAINVGDGHDLSCVLHDDQWIMQQSGAMLIVQHRKTGARYAIPWGDVKAALFPKDEPAPAPAKKDPKAS